MNPAVAALLGVLVLREQFTFEMAFAFGLVIAGSALATRPVSIGVVYRDTTGDAAAAAGALHCGSGQAS